MNICFCNQLNSNNSHLNTEISSLETMLNNNSTLSSDQQSEECFDILSTAGSPDCKPQQSTNINYCNVLHNTGPSLIPVLCTVAHCTTLVHH